MKGRYGAFELYDGIPQSIAQCVTDDFVTLNINLCNRGNSFARMRVAITSLESEFNEDCAWLEYDALVEPKGVLERTGLLVPAGSYITVQTTGERVSAQAYGIGIGDTLDIPAIEPNLLMPTTELTVYGTGEYNLSQRLGVTSTSEGPVTYSVTSGSLPGSLALSTDGVLTGVLPLLTTDVIYTIGIRAYDGTTAKETTLTLTTAAPDGETIDGALPSGAWLADNFPAAADGYYWVKPTGDTAYRVWIDNTRNGGGWVLVVRATLRDYYDHVTQDAVRLAANTGPEPLQIRTSKIEDTWIQALRDASTYTGTTAYWVESTGTWTNGAAAKNMFVSSSATVNLLESANADNERTKVTLTYEGGLDDRDCNSGTRGFGDHHTSAGTYFAYGRHPETAGQQGFREDGLGSSDGHVWVK